MTSKYDRHPTELADLKGARMVVGSEVEHNSKELLSNVVYGHIESSGDLLNRNHFNSIFESCAFNDFGQVTKAS